MALIVLIGLLLRSHDFYEPYVDYHSWRQTDTAMVARNFLRNGFDILSPEVDYGSEPSVIQLELQVTTYLTAILYSFFGVKAWVGRVVPVAFSIFAVTYLFKTIQFYHNREIALFSCFAYYTSPLNVFFTRVLMPESAMLFLSVASLFHFSRYLSDENRRDYAITIFLTSAALLSKLPNIFMLIPMGYLSYRKYGYAVFHEKRVICLVLIPILALSLYSYHITSVAEVYTAMSLNPRDIIAKVTNMWQDSGTYNRIFKHLHWLAFTELGLVLLILGLVVDFNSENKLFFFWLFSAASFTFFSVGLSDIHSYYQMPWLPAGSFFIGSGMYWIYRSKHRYLAYLLCMGLLITSMVNVSTLYNKEAAALYEAGLMVSNIAPSDSLIIGVPHRHVFRPEILYFADRRGWILYPVHDDGDKRLSMSKILEYETLGAEYVVITKPAFMKKFYIQDKEARNYLREKRTYVGEDYLIVYLTEQDGIQRGINTGST